MSCQITKNPSFPAVSWTDEATIISLFSLSFLSTQLASPSSCSSFLQENPDLLLTLFFSPKEGKVSASMVLILAKARSCNPETHPITPLFSSFGFVIMVSFLLFLFDSFLMDAGAPAEVMSMAPAKTVEAHGTRKCKHPADTTADKLKAIALSKPPSPGSLIKQVQVISLLDDLFLDLDRVFSSNTQY